MSYKLDRADSESVIRDGLPNAHRGDNPRGIHTRPGRVRRAGGRVRVQIGCAAVGGRGAWKSDSLQV
jgi:hypothetical protein